MGFTLHVSGSWWTLWQLLITLWLIGLAVGAVLDARLRYWKKEVIKSIKAKIVAGVPTKIEMDGQKVVKVDGQDVG